MMGLRITKENYLHGYERMTCEREIIWPFTYLSSFALCKIQHGSLLSLHEVNICGS